MTTMQASAFGERTPTPIEQEDADRLRRIMESTRGSDGGYNMVLKSHEDLGPIHLDQALGDTLVALLGIIAKGCSVRITPIEEMLTTKQAAILLGVSRPYLIKLLEQGDIRHSTVGRHRRIRAADLLDYKRDRERRRDEALARMLEDDGL